METRAKLLLRWSVVVAYCGLIFALSSLPSEDIPLPPLLWQADKLLHALEFGFLSLLVSWALGVGRFRRALIALLFASAYGLTDEFHQSFVLGRSASWLDWLADTAGAALVQGWMLWKGR